MDLGLKGKVLLAAASTEGLGFGIAEKAVEEGAKVFIGSRTEEKVKNALEALAVKAESWGGQVAGGVLDMSSPESIAAWTQKALETFGAIDALLVNSGGPPPGNFEAFADDEAWQKAFEVTLLSSVRLIRAALPALKTKGGSILTISSSSVKEPWPGLILSGVMRSGVSSLVKSLSVELAPYKIRVNNLGPGKIMTARQKRILANDAAKKGIGLEAHTAAASAEIPLRRIGEVDEFARMGVFLLSDAASYISGQTLIVDGGASKFLY